MEDNLTINKSENINKESNEEYEDVNDDDLNTKYFIFALIIAVLLLIAGGLAIVLVTNNLRRRRKKATTNTTDESKESNFLKGLTRWMDRKSNHNLSNKFELNYELRTKSTKTIKDDPVDLRNPIKIQKIGEESESSTTDNMINAKHNKSLIKSIKSKRIKNIKLNLVKNNTIK